MTSTAHIIELIADVIDVIVVAILVIGVVIALARASRTFARDLIAGEPSDFYTRLRLLRYDVGQVLLLALQMLIISDILHTIVRRTLDELLMLAVIVAIRIALSYFLDREMSLLHRHLPDSQRPTGFDRSA